MCIGLSPQFAIICAELGPGFWQTCSFSKQVYRGQSHQRSNNKSKKQFLSLTKEKLAIIFSDNFSNWKFYYDPIYMKIVHGKQTKDLCYCFDIYRTKPKVELWICEINIPQRAGSWRFLSELNFGVHNFNLKKLAPFSKLSHALLDLSHKLDPILSANLQNLQQLS